MVASRRPQLIAIGLVTLGALILVFKVRTAGEHAGAHAAATAAASASNGELTPTPPSVVPGASALLDGLEVGAALGAWTLVRERVDERRLRLEFERAGSGLTVWVARHGVSPHEPPHTTEHYAIFYGGAYGDPVAESEATGLAEQVHARVLVGERTAPTPEGL